MALTKLNNLYVTPPGGWGYLVKETGKRFSGYTTKDGLRVALGQHCAVHNLPIPNDEMIQEYICQQLGRDALDWCVDEQGQQQHAYTGQGGCHLSFSKILAGTGTLLHWVAASLLKLKFQRAAGFEAEQRGRTCTSCIECQPISGCSGCSWPALRQLIQSAVQGGTTTSDSYLEKRGCCLCGCSSLALIWMPLPILHAHLSEADNSRLPDHCWKKIKKPLVA